MDRRNFLKLAGLTSIALFAPWATRKEASADEAIWGGPYFLHMHASGGWDPTMFCDGKLTVPGATPEYENKLVTQVTELNGIMVPVATAQGKYLLGGQGTPMEDPLDFFQTVGKNVLVFNGVDTMTNNHDIGVQAGACGHNDRELPALAALFAGMVSAQRQIPMAFLAGGQYNRTGDVVGISRFPGDKVPLLAEPFKGGANDETALVSDLAVRRILEMRNERLTRLEAQATLPRNKRTLGAVRSAMAGGASINLLKAVASGAAPAIDSFAPNLAADTRDYLTTAQNGGTPRFIDLGRPLETILRCFQAGVSASATFAQGGFDTHANHDVAQSQSLGSFVARLRYVILRAAQLGLSDKLYVLVTSDFGRTPRYNTGNGKDHWNVTSTLVLGPNVRGGRALGRTTEGHKAMRVATKNPAEVLPDADESGSRIRESHIHRELRRVLGLEQAAFINQFPLPATDEPLPLLA